MSCPMATPLLVLLVVFLYVVRSNAQETCFRRNEVLECVKDCPPERTCRNRGVRFNCLADKENCSPKCVCKDGFNRNPLGDCISDKECDQCHGKNEYYACDSACDNVCATMHLQNRTSCPIVNIKCNEKCYCEDGFARDKDDECVPVQQCPPVTEASKRNARESPTGHNCGQHEEFNPCMRSCPPQTCISIVAFFKCDSKQPCKPACACKPGFLRKEDGSPCAPSRECPQLANSPDFN